MGVRNLVAVVDSWVEERLDWWTERLPLLSAVTYANLSPTELSYRFHLSVPSAEGIRNADADPTSEVCWPLHAAGKTVEEAPVSGQPLSLADRSMVEDYVDQAVERLAAPLNIDVARLALVAGDVDDSLAYATDEAVLAMDSTQKTWVAAQVAEGIENPTTDDAPDPDMDPDMAFRLGTAMWMPQPEVPQVVGWPRGVWSGRFGDVPADGAVVPHDEARFGEADTDAWVCHYSFPGPIGLTIPTFKWMLGEEVPGASDEEQWLYFTPVRRRLDCPECEGTGTVDNEPDGGTPICSSCGGSGERSRFIPIDRPTVQQVREWAEAEREVGEFINTEDFARRLVEAFPSLASSTSEFFGFIDVRHFVVRADCLDGKATLNVVDGFVG